MKVLFIGGTGNISTSVSILGLEKGIDLYHLNRGNKSPLNGVTNIQADINNFNQVQNALSNQTWDVVVNWVAFTPQDTLRDIKLFEGRVGQYIFISSASVYQKPTIDPIITESTPIFNPNWEYSNNKIACEDHLMQACQERNFPVTIIRPSHTYDTVIPVTLGGWDEYTVVDRIKKGLPIVVQDDGTSLWTLTHAKDFAKGFIGLVGNQTAIGEPFHITSDEVMSWNQIYQTLAASTGYEANIVHIPSGYICDFADEYDFPSKRGSLLADKSFNTVFDNSKIKKFVPDFSASIPFSKGIRQTLDWFESDQKRMIVKEETNRFLDGLIANYGK
ncbi:MAG: SDR family oxidoreductase [Saprospiraceae bacterium]|jgi:nucleoside-diphosphate-sugar epimerase|nr:SDR family oxidoreductase [Saprospiraceae bacterium]MBL0024597.1 SDR family oxidoreductase [Saprospiraceae bacterium]